jgi:hypothetical protein
MDKKAFMFSNAIKFHKHTSLVAYMFSNEKGSQMAQSHTVAQGVPTSQMFPILVIELIK